MSQILYLMLISADIFMVKYLILSICDMMVLFANNLNNVYLVDD